MEPILVFRSAQALKQEAEEIGHEEKEVAEYVKRHQALDRKGRLGEMHNESVRRVLILAGCDIEFRFK